MLAIKVINIPIITLHFLYKNLSLLVHRPGKKIWNGIDGDGDCQLSSCVINISAVVNQGFLL
jgi:hypothetical protein